MRLPAIVFQVYGAMSDGLAMLRPTRRSRLWLVAGLTLLLTSCGGDDAGTGTIRVVNGVAGTPAVSSSPTPSASPAPTPAPTPVAALELYTIGNLTWSFQGDVPDDVRGPITDVMTWALNQTNTLADYRGNVTVTYNAGTPTAEAGYDYHIQFGGYITWNSAIHELAHWLGSGTYWAWERNVSNERFTGPITNSRIKAFDGPNAVLNADRFHFWPYGYNGDDPFHEWQRNVAIVSAQRADMGLSDGAALIAGARRFVNRSSKLLLDGSGAVPSAATPGAARSLTWNVTYVDGYVVLTNVASGQVIDSLGRTDDGGATGMATAAAGPRQQWEMIPTDGGWFLLRNRETRRCLDNVGDLAAGTPIRVWVCGGHPNQQWHLVR